MAGSAIDFKLNMTQSGTPWQCCLRAVPSPDEGGRLAHAVRAAAQPNNPHRLAADLHAICRAGRFRVIEREMGAAAGGAEAVLVPQPNNRFHIWVDATPRLGWDSIAPELRPMIRRQRLRFRIAHEIGHSFFYRRCGGEPRRVLGDSEEQERFADEFARALLVPAPLPSTVAPTPDGVLKLHRYCDVSLEVAARAVAAEVRPLSVLLAHWPTEADPNADSPHVQWASENLTRQGVDAVRSSVRAITETARSVVCGDHPKQDAPRGSACVLKRRRQLLWIGEAVTASGSAQS